MKRILLITIFVMLIALIFSGLANFFFIKKLDTRYSSAISSDMQAVLALRAITRESVLRQRELNNILLTADKKSPQVLLCRAKMKEASLRNDQNYQQLEKMTKDPGSQGALLEVLTIRKLYNTESSKVLQLIDQERGPEALIYKNEVLRPIFENYLGAQDVLAEKLEAFNQERNASISEWSAFFRWISLGLSTWPMILITILGAGILVTSFLMGWNMPDEQM